MTQHQCRDVPLTARRHDCRISCGPRAFCEGVGEKKGCGLSRGGIVRNRRSSMGRGLDDSVSLNTVLLVESGRRLTKRRPGGYEEGGVRSGRACGTAAPPR